MDDNNCHILIFHLTFAKKFSYMISHEIMKSYNINRKSHDDDDDDDDDDVFLVSEPGRYTQIMRWCGI